MDFLAVPVAPFRFSIAPASAPSISQQPRPRRLNPPSSPSTPPPWAASGPPWSALASEPAGKAGIISDLGRGILDTGPGAQHHAQRDWAGATMGRSTSSPCGASPGTGHGAAPRPPGHARPPRAWPPGQGQIDRAPASPRLRERLDREIGERGALCEESMGLLWPRGYSAKWPIAIGTLPIDAGQRTGLFLALVFLARKAVWPKRFFACLGRMPKSSKSTDAASSWVSPASPRRLAILFQDSL